MNMAEHRSESGSTTRPRAVRTRFVALLLIVSLFGLTAVASPPSAAAMEEGQAWTLRYLGADPTFADNLDFRFDATTGLYSNVDVAFSGLPVFSALRPGVTHDASAVSFVAQVVEDMTGVDVLELSFAEPLTNAGGTVALTAALLGTCNADCSEVTNTASFSVGFVSTFPAATNDGHEYFTDPQPNSNGWNNSDITIDFSWDPTGAPFDEFCDISAVESSEGEQGYYASCLDANASVMSLRYMFKIDKTAPETTITASEIGTNGDSATVEFEGSDALSGLASFECAVDGDDYSGCVSPFVVRDAAYGDHTVTVRAVDLADNVDGTAAEFAWTANNDFSAPTASPAFSPTANENGWYTNDVTVDFNWVDETDGSGISRAECATVLTTTEEGVAVAYAGSCVDNAGNSATTSGTLNIDKTAPVVAITDAPAPVIDIDSASFAFIATDTVTPANELVTECSLDGADFVPCTSPFAVAALTESEHEFVVRSTDNAGLLGVSTHSWIVELPPVYTCLDLTGTVAELQALGFNVVIGTEESDDLTGTGGADFIVALGGDDKIRSRGGNDVVCGGGGNDEIVLGRGADQASGGAGEDNISGNGGADLIYGGADNDTVHAGSGADAVHGDQGDDLLIGAGGDDHLSAGLGTDECQVGRGSDTALDCEVVTSQ